MPNTREKLIELIRDAVNGCSSYWAGLIADNLIDNGVVVSKMETATIATDNPVGDKLTPTAKDTNVPSKWIPVTERLPKNFVSVLGYMTDAGDFPPVRECYTVGNAFFFPALGDKHPVSHWMEIPEPPKEVE